MESVPAELSPMAQDRRITILEENAKRFDRDLRDVKAEMSEGFRQVGGELKSLSGKLDSIILTQVHQTGKNEGGWMAAAKIGAVITGAGGLLLAAAKLLM